MCILSEYDNQPVEDELEDPAAFVDENDVDNMFHSLFKCIVEDVAWQKQTVSLLF